MRTNAQTWRAFIMTPLQTTPPHINVCGLLYSVFLSDSPVPKETVFTRAETLYGCDGPGVGHPFAGRYDIISATFECLEPHPAADRYKFKISDPHDSSVITSATLHDGHMRTYLQAGDILRVEVVSSSLHHAQLRVPTCVGCLDVDSLDEETVTHMLQRKPLAVVNVLSLGFFHTDTHKFVSRPFAEAFLLLMNRHFHLSTTSTCTGITL